MSAVELILRGCQRMQFQEADALGTLLGAALMRRAPGVVAMAIAPGRRSLFVERRGADAVLHARPQPYAYRTAASRRSPHSP